MGIAVLLLEQRTLMRVAMLLLAPGLFILATPGDLDTAFSGDGMSMTARNTALISVESGAAIDSQGRVVYAGYRQNGSTYAWGIWRTDASGDADTAFSGDGEVTLYEGTSHNVAWAVAVDSQDRVVAAGRVKASNGYTDVRIIRLLTDGSLDPSFGTGGAVTKAIFSGKFHDEARAVIVQPDGKILASGCAKSGTPNLSDFVLRLNPDGTYDATFGTTGVKIEPAGGQVLLAPGGMALDSSGNISLVYGGSRVDSRTSTGTLRWRTTVTGFPGIASAYLRGVTHDSADNVIAAGEGTKLGDQPDMIAVRLIGTTGALDPTFDGDGKYVSGIPGRDGGYGALVQSDGRIIIGGTKNSTAPLTGLAVRLNADGSHDQTFQEAVFPGATVLNSTLQPVFHPVSGDIVQPLRLRNNSNGSYEAGRAQWLP